MSEGGSRSTIRHVVRDQTLKLRQLERVLQKIQRGCAGRPDDAPCVVEDAFVLRRWLWRRREATVSRHQDDKPNVELSFRLVADCRHGTRNDYWPVGEVRRSP